MADTRVTIDVDINTSPAAQGLRDLQQRFNAFTGSLNKNNAMQATASRQYADQLMNLVNSGKFFTAEMTRMQTAAGRLDKTLAKGQATMGQFFSARFLRNSTEAAQVLSLANARAAALQTQFFATGAAANGMRDAIAVRPYEAFNNALAVSTQKLAIHRAMLMQATTHMINFGKNTQWAGRQLMVGFTVPLTIFGGVAGKVFRELEEQAINFKKVYGDIFTTDVETEQALDAVRELSLEFTKYGIAVKDTMELAGVAAQSGLRNAELMAATTQATRLATLGQMEQAEAMKTIISLQTAFKTSNEGLAESVDFLNLVENQTVLALQDVAGAIPRVAPVIQGLGGDVKDLAVLLVAMKEGGVTAGEGANALKSSLGRLIVPTDKASKMARGFGINLEQIVENNRGELLPMILELGNAMESLGSLERQQLLTTIFGKFQYARIGALFDNITRDSSQAARAIDLMGMSAEQLGQIAEKELGTVEQSVGARFTAAMERAKVAIAPLGEAFLNLSIPVINMVASIIDKFNQLPDFAKKFAVFGSVIVGVVIPVGTMFLGLLMNLIGTLIKFGSIVGIAFKGFTTGGIRGAINAVSQALNYMSLEEIDAALAAQQLGTSTQHVNEALRMQVPRAAAATTAIEALGLQYAQLVVRMREAAALSGAAGAFGVPGSALGAASAAQRARPLRRNSGGPIPFATGNTVPGVGNTDTVPAVLTPGEFVVNKQAAQENIGLLNAINDGKTISLNKGGGVASKGRMFYGPKLDADSFEAAIVATREALGQTNVADDAARATAAITSSRWNQALLIGRMPKSLVDDINDSFAEQLKILGEAKGIQGLDEADLRIIRDLPLGTSSLNESTNNSLRQSRASIDDLITQHKEDDVYKELFETNYIKNKLGSQLNAERAKAEIDSEMYRLLQVEKRRRLIFGEPEDAMSDSQYKVLSRLAFEKAGHAKLWDDMAVETLGARRVGLETGSVARTAAGGRYEVPMTAALDDLVSKGKISGYSVESLGGRKKGYLLEDNNGNLYRIETSATRDIPGEISYQQEVSSRPGKVKAHFMNNGNIVPGVGNKDTVPAVLTPGEFVVNKEATRKNLDILHAINNGTIAGFAGGGGVGMSTVIPMGDPLLPGMKPGPTSPIPVKDVEAEKDRKSMKNLAKKGGMGAAKFGASMALGFPGFMLGEKAGEAVGGETGALVGGMVGGIGAGFLPYLPYGKMGAGIKGMMGAKAVSGAAGAGGIGGIGSLGGAAGAANVARFMPMLLNPFTAAIAAVVAASAGVVITLKKMNESNQAEYDAGRKLADAMSTSAEDIQALGSSARERIKNIDSYLNASQSEIVQQEYATKIAEAKTKQEKERLRQERDIAVKERGTLTRAEAIDAFYKKEIKQAKQLQMSQEHLRNLYEQRNLSLGRLISQEADFEIDQTYGAEFIKGAGQKQFDQFKDMRSTLERVRTGEVSKAQAETVTKLADAAYGMSMTFEKIAERDMASKLAQYVLSGSMTQDQAASVAEAIGAELGDLQIGKDIREQLTGIVGVEGAAVKYAPGSVAEQLADENTRRVEELRNLVYSSAGSMFTTNKDSLRDQFSALAATTGIPLGIQVPMQSAMQQTRTYDEQKFRSGAPTSLNLFNQFFSGMADEFRRRVGSLIELQSNEIQMLEENIAAVALNYDDLIGKAKTLAEEERLKIERSRVLAKLQKRADDARAEQLRMAFGTENKLQVNAALRPYRERREAVQSNELQMARTRDRLEGLDALGLRGFNKQEIDRNINGILDRAAGYLNIAIGSMVKGFNSFKQKAADKLEQMMPSSFAQEYANQTARILSESVKDTPQELQLTMLQDEILGSDLTSPENIALSSQMLNDKEMADSILASAQNVATLVKQGMEFNDIGEAAGTMVLQGMGDILRSDISVEVKKEYSQFLASANLAQIEAYQLGLESLEEQFGTGMKDLAVERFTPILALAKQVSTLKTPGMGGKNLFESLFGDMNNFKVLAQNDEGVENLMRFFTFLADLPPDLQIPILEDKSIAQMMLLGKRMDEFNPVKFKKNIKDIRKILKSGLIPEAVKFDEGARYIELTMDRLSKIKDPEIKAKVSAEISPLVQEALTLLQKLETATSPQEIADIVDRAADLMQESNVSISAAEEQAATQEEGGGGGGGGGGSRPDTLGETLRSLRDQISAREKQGADIYAANEKAKGIFLRLRGQGANEAVIDYLKSLSPEEALRVGNELLGNQKKLNSLMGLMAQNAVAQQKEAAKAAKERTKTMQFLSQSQVVGRMSAILGSDALNDPEFIQGMTDAAGGKNPNKEQREFLRQYNAQKKAEREFMIAQMPATVAGEAQRNRLQQRAQFQLANAGLTQAEIDVGLANENIRLAIEEKINAGEELGSEVINSIKNLADSQKTPIDRINESVDDIVSIYGEISNILQAAMDKIEEFNIVPLQDQLEDIQKQSSEFSEQQRRLSRNLSDLQEKENDLKEAQKQKEEAINESYDLRIEALEKVDKINKDIEERQKGQLTVADALSRGDIGAAAKAAQEMQAKAAQSRREEAIQAMRDQKEEDMDNLKKAHEEELKNLTVNVNGELLTREQIQERIDAIEEKVYQNSLLEYELQQKITAEREKQEKISRIQEKASRASNIVSRIGQLGDQDLTEGQRSLMLDAIRAEVSVLGGTGAQQLESYLTANRQDLVSGNIGDLAFDLAGSINTFMQGFAGDFANMISPENLTVDAADLAVDGVIDTTQIPALDQSISDILSGAFSSASATVQTSLDTLDGQLSDWEDKVVKTNPFDVLIGGTEKLIKKAKEFLDSIPKEKGSGGESKKKKKDEEKVTTPDGFERFRLNKGADYAYIDKLFKQRDALAMAERMRGQRYEERKPYIYTQGLGSPYLLDVQKRKGDYQAPDTWTGGAAGVGAPMSSPGAMAGFEAASPQDLVTNILSGFYLDKKTSVKPGSDIGNFIIQAITDKILEGAVDYDAAPVAQAVEEALKARGAFNINTPAKRMFPIGESIAEGIFKKMVEKIKNIPQEFMNNFISGVKSIFGIKDEESSDEKVTGVGTGLSRGILQGLKTAIKLSPIGIITNFISGMLSLFGITEGDEAGATEGRVTGVGTGLAKGIFSGLLAAAKVSPIGLLVNIVGSIARALGISVGENGSPGEESTDSSILSIGGATIQGVFQGVLDWFDGKSVGNFVEDLLERTETMLSDAFTKSSFLKRMGEIGGGIWNAVKDGILGAIAGLGELAGAARDALGINNGGEVQKRAFGGMINYKGSREPAPGMMMGGKVKKYAFGSFVPGSGMTDKVPALLTPGEFVVRKSVAQQMLPTLKEMNSQVFPGMGIPQQRSFSVSSPQFDTMKKMSVDQVRFGIPQTLNSFTYPTTNMNMTQSNTEMNPTNNNVGPTNVQYNYNLKVTANTNASPDDIANTVMYKIKRFDDRRIRGTQVG